MTYIEKMAHKETQVVAGREIWKGITKGILGEAGEPRLCSITEPREELGQEELSVMNTHYRWY